MKKYSLKTFVSIAVLGAVAFVIMLIQFPLLPSAPFLKLDFSDVPAMIGGLLFGPLAIILIEFVKNVLEYLVTGSFVGVPVGELTNFLSGICFVLPIYYVFRYARSTKAMILGVGIGTVMLTVVISLLNYFVVLPFYITVGGLPAGTNIAALVTTAIIPFNILKGVVVGAVFILVYGRMRSWIMKNTIVKLKVSKDKKHHGVV
ncbi:ECF transporter S component [Listeria booriae]|uniref:ECF transporter S component n=1 Tax=Listeria booriae TaxID=1552123 RepID=UPI00162749A0|nr:ECF transporter S component [Listeria booriae]MBC1334255.1 ECF transporter S component [Listeria booriae]MBC1512759.1 ECF transporter S component [Listeria booriae]MBC1649045.1 ECF transporter S component [Listeria booriae]MBC1944322.1 ECF transporter S component [Listeria booriae]MBC6128421.1 ECF transporter S component [Listeria booriae]